MDKYYRFVKQTTLRCFAGIFLLLGHIALVNAHGASAVLGEPRTFSGVAFVTCSYEDDGPAQDYYLTVQIRDNSPQVSDLLTSVHVFKGNHAVSVTDTTPGDAEHSPFVELRGGTGVYFVIVSKTAAGERSFDLEYHCMSGNDNHTGTEIGVTQYGVPEGRNF